MLEPEPEPLNVWEEGTSPSSPLSSVSSFQQMRKQRHRKLQASQEHRREGRRLQAECHELRRRVEELALLESLLLKHISKEIYGTLKPKSRNLSKENSPVSEIAAEKSPEGFIHHSESLKELAAENVIKEDPGILKKLQQELSQIQSLATHERAALDRATRKLEAHFLEQRVYTEMEEDERALKDSEVEESRLKTASVERELRSLSRDIARLKQLCQDLGDDLGTFSCKARNGSGKGVTAQNDNEEISKIQKNPVLVELERLQGEKAELEKEAKDRHGILGMQHGDQGSMELMLARSTGFDKGVHWSTTSSEFDSKCLEDDYGLASYSGEISSVNSTTSETLMPKHEGRSNSFSSVTKCLDFGAPETDLNLMEPPGSMNIGDRSGKAFSDVNRDDGEVEDGWGEIEDLNSDAKDLGLELQKMEADSHTTHVLVQLQNAHEEFEQEISDVKDSIAGKTEEGDNEWTWGSQEEVYQASNDPSNLEQFVPEMAEPYSASPMDGNVLMQDFDPELAKSGSAVDKLKGIAFESREIVPPKKPQIANEEKRINESSPDMDGKDSVDNSELPLLWKMDKNVEPSYSRDSTLLLQEHQLPEAGNIDELVRGTAHEKDEMCCIDMSELPQLRNQNEREEISSETDQSISLQEPEAGNWDRLLEGTVHDMEGAIPPDIVALPPHRSQDEEGKEIASDTDQNISLQEPEAGNRDELLDGTVHNMDKTFPPDVLALPPQRNQDEQGKEILSDRDWNQSIEHEFLQAADEENFAVEEIFEGNANDVETFPVDMSELPLNKDEIETISSKREESISLQEHRSSQVHDVNDLGKTSPDVNANPTPEVSESHKLTVIDDDNSEFPSEMGQQNTLQEHGNADDLLKEIASEIQEPNFFLQEEDEEFMLHEHVIHESGTTDEKFNKMGIEFDVTLEDSFNDKVQMLLPQDGGLPQICDEDGKLEEIPFKIEYRTDLLTERSKAEFKGFCDLPYTSASEMLPESEVSKGGKKLLQDHAMSQSRDAADKLDGMSPDYEGAGTSSRSMNKAKLSEDIRCSKNQAEKLRGLIGPIDELANDIQRQQKLQEELDQRLDIEYKEWVQNEAQQEALREALPVSVMPWSEETEKVSLILEHQQVLLQNKVEEAEKLQCAAEKRVNTLNDQIQDLEVICDVAQSIESVVICKDEALQFMLWTIVQALLLWLSLLVWLNRFMDPMEGSLRPT